MCNVFATEEYREFRYSGFFVSNLGGLKTKDGKQIVPIRISKYKAFTVRSNHIYLHHAVTECFLGIRSPYYEVNHKDGDKLNNRLDNLEYVSHRQNMRHAIETGLIDPSKIKRGKMPKRLTYDEKFEIATVSQMYGFRMAAAAREYEVTTKTIQRVLNEYLRGIKRPSHFGDQREIALKRTMNVRRTLANKLMIPANV